jgi:hypothetical protein
MLDFERIMRQINKKEQTGSLSFLPKDRKGQLGNLQGIILTLVVVGILLGVMYLVLESVQTNLSTKYTIASYSINPTTAGVYTLYNSTSANFTCFHNFQVTQVVNASGTLTIQPGNYTWNPDTGLFQNLSRGQEYLALWNISFTYENGGAGCAGVRTTITSANNINSFLPILVIIGIVGILLAIVFGIILPKAGGGGRIAEV